ncbi:putative uncharacterized protein ART2, partial [Lachnellula suecica]
GEQSNAYRILLRYDRKSRHRRIKKQRRYERLAATSQFRTTYQTIMSLMHNCVTDGITLTIKQSAVSSGRSSYLKLSRSPHLTERCTGRLCSEGADSAAGCLNFKVFRPGVTRTFDAKVWDYCNPCGNFSGTSSLKFRGTKGSIGHTFMVCIHTENQNQGDFYPFVLLEISVLHESPLGHLRYGLTDVPPQPNSPPDNVFNPDQPAKDLNARSWALTPSSALLNK